MVVTYQHNFLAHDSDAADPVGRCYVARRHGVNWLCEIIVDEVYRHQGHGTALVRAAQAAYADRGGLCVLVWAHGGSPLSDEELTNWYGRLGFRPTECPGVMQWKGEPQK